MKRSYLVVIILIFISYHLLFTTYLRPGQHGNPITIGINEWTGYDPFIVANKVGLFNKNNILVEVKRFASATDEIEALKNGQIQGGGFTLDEVFTIVDSGFKGHIVLVIDYSMGGDMLIGQKEVTSVRHLAGKTIGFEGSVVGEFLLDRALRKNYIKRNNVELIDIPADKWLSAFKQKNIDALVCFNPVAAQLLGNYEGNLLFSSADMPYEIIDVLFFSESFYKNNQIAITKILKTWFDALRYIDTHLDEAAGIISVEKNISPEIYKAGLNGFLAPDLVANKAILNSKSDENIFKYSQVIVDFMLSEGLLSQRINTEDIFRPETLFALEPKSAR